MHTYRAELDNGKIVVRDGAGNNVTQSVTFAATEDFCTCSAHIKGVGYIGGWECVPKRLKRRFADLVPSINAGVLYHTSDALPTGARYRKRR